jgi:RHS repeat-associated protein
VDSNREHAQVLAELTETPGRPPQRTRWYAYGHDRLAQYQSLHRVWAASYYGHDAHGSVRVLTDARGAMTDMYDYDAYGVLRHHTGTTPNVYLYTGEQFDALSGLYDLRARHMSPTLGRFSSRDPFEGFPFEPLSRHPYLYAQNDPVNGRDPSGRISLSGVMTTTAGLVMAVGNLAGRLVPSAYLASSRFAYWVFANQVRIEFYASLGALASTFLEVSTNLLLHNAQPVQIVNNNPGVWMQEVVGANMTAYELIDDFRDGNAMSIKTNQQSMGRLIAAISHEAETLGNRTADFQPIRSARSSVPPLPLSQVTTRTVMMVIPETHAFFLRDSTFIQAVRQIQQANGVIVRVVPLRGWKVPR